MELKNKIAILGGGIAGLTAANYLKEKDIPFMLYEAAPRLAGLAMSFKDEEGFSHDFGAHFITNRLANAIGIGTQCRVVKHYGEAVWLKGKSYGYPFGLMRIPKMSLSFLNTKMKSLSSKQDSSTAAGWFRERYGEALANEVALPLIEAWSGAPAEKLSAAIGQSLPGSILNTFYLKAASVLSRRAVACGYNREMPEIPSVWHVYPEGGVARLCEKLAEGLTDSIRLQSPVQEILIENERAVAVKVNGQIEEVSAVISTAPAHILAKLVSGTHALDGASKFRFRPMVFVNMRFEGERLLPDTVVWFPEKKFPFFRLTEVTRSMPWLAPKGKSIITVDIGCEKGDEFWSMDEKDLEELCLQSMNSIIPEVKQRFLGSDVLRTPIAYPVFLNEYEKERLEFEESTHIDNLLSIGRNGEFAHRFMEDIYWRTRKKIQKLLEMDLEKTDKHLNAEELAPMRR